MTTFAELPSQATADGQLVRAYLDDGDDDAFAELFERHRRHVLATLVQRVDRGLAQELAQETWLRVLQYLHTFDTSRPFWPWVRKIALNLVPGALSQRSGEVPLDDFRAEPVLADPADSFVEYDRVMACLATLPPRQRDALRLRYLEDLDSGTVAELFGCKRNAVEQLLLRARVNLRAAIGPRSAAVPGIPTLMPRLRRVLEGLAARVQAASTATMAAAGDVAVGAALTIGTIGTIGIAQGILPEHAPETVTTLTARAAGRPPAAGGGTIDLPHARERHLAVAGPGEAASPGVVAAVAGDSSTDAQRETSRQEAAAPDDTAVADPAAPVEPGQEPPVHTAGTKPGPVPSSPPDAPSSAHHVPAPPVADEVEVESEANPEAVEDGGDVATSEVEYEDEPLVSIEVSLAEEHLCTLGDCLVDP